MVEKSECNECNTWEEEMYWTHFNSLHFILTLPPYFHDHIVLPEKFASHTKVLLPDKVSLKAPNGALWDVDVLKSDDIIFVGNEWKDFVIANNVKENSLLMFKYDRNSSFEVLIFDRENSCEREGSYFLKKCRHTKSPHNDQNKKTYREASSTELIEYYNDEDDDFVSSKKIRKHDRPRACSGLKSNTESSMKRVLQAAVKGREKLGKLELPSRPKVHTNCQPTVDDTAIEPNPISNWGSINFENEDNFQAIVHFHQSKDQSDKEKSASGSVKEVTPISCQVPDDRESSPKKDHIKRSGGKRSRAKKKGLHDSLKKLVFKNVSGQKKCSSERISIRRQVTKEEKESALQRAIHKETDNSFTAVMRPTSVYRRFFLNIPSKWPLKHLLRRFQDVILRVGEKTWLTTFTNYGSSRGLYHGWKRFSLDNDLEEFDVLVFTPVVQKVGAAMVMDVDIFKVI